ncbi:hypothetical protein MMC15_004521 [Xylographa vitiligo]|nr:hypothetical protein [Xylographa vitiligo]
MESAPAAYTFIQPLPNGYPWSTRGASTTNPYKDPPDTGVTRYYTFDIERGTASPDGYQKDVLFVNGQFPGPAIEANWGDWIQVTANNKISGPEEGTALHWHGLLQTATPWYDGVPSVQQCPIAPGQSFTYRFKADLYGTSWYHSHYSAQYAGGLMGPMIIHGPSNAAYDIDLGPVFITDWYHKEYFEIVKEVESTNQTLWLQYSDNNLINGKMNFDCSTVTDGTPCHDNAGLSKFVFTPGKTHRLRLINAGAAGLQHFSIDNHIMTVIANDYVPIVPYNATTVTLGIGQRTDILVTANGSSTGAYWMRSNIDTICALPKQPNALAVIYYNHANTSAVPNTTAWPYTDDGRCANDDLSLTTPFFPITPAPVPAFTQELVIDEAVNATGHLDWRINYQPFRGNYNYPLLLLAQEKNTSYPMDPEWNVYNFGSNGTVRLVVNNNSTISHPMHLHGHNMYILHQGPGFWDGVSITNPSNPQRRDVQMLSPSSHIVIQYDADNPGVWPFHCHIAWHLSLGLYMNIIEQPAQITEMQIPEVVPQTCINWDKYSNTNVVDQIDSGL